MFQTPSRLLYATLIILVSCSSIRSIRRLPQDSILPIGKHTFEFTCGNLTREETHMFTLTVTLIGHGAISTRIPCNNSEQLTITLTINDPGSYFLRTNLVDKLSQEMTNKTISFELVKPYQQPYQQPYQPIFAPTPQSLPTPDNPFKIIHVSDLGRMDGFKGHLLQQLIHLPHGLYQQAVVDLSCSAPDKKVFRKYLDDWNLPYLSECIQIPQPRWNSVAEWVNDLKNLDKCKTLKEVDPMMLLALRPLVDILLKADIMVMTNGSGDYDSYLIPLGRLTRTRVVLDLGPKGPLSLPWTMNGLTTFVTQSTFVTSHPDVLSTGVQLYQNPPIVDVMSFSYPDATRTCPGRNKQPIRVGFIGRLAAQKGPGMFIRAAALVSAAASASTTVPVTFVVAGIGHLEFDLRQLAVRLNVTIEFMGYIENNKLKCLLYNLDVFVFSSMFEESFGMSAVEAMLMNVPVVGFGVGGSQDFLIHNKTGLVVQERTPQALAAAVLELAIDDERRNRLGRAASLLVHQNYNPSKILQQYKDMYGEIMASPAL